MFIYGGNFVEQWLLLLDMGVCECGVGARRGGNVI